ncbi:hypothetical protein BH10BDE1_BH10BDE1_16660 [soil metagenome]
MLFADAVILFGIFGVFTLKSLIGERFSASSRPFLVLALAAGVMLYWLGALMASAYFLKVVFDFIALRFVRNGLRFWIFVVSQILALVFYKYELQPNVFYIRDIGLSFHLLFVCQYAIAITRDAKERLSFQDHVIVFTYFPAFLAGPITSVHQLRDDLVGDSKRQGDMPAGMPSATSNLAPVVLMFFLGLFKISLKSFFAPTYTAGIVESSIYFNIFFYFELSGYSDLAIAFSQLIGVRLSANFDRPLFRYSVTKMWQTWHMTVMNWFNEYVYFPLQYASWLRWISPRLRFRIVVIFTFVLVGIWHQFSPAFIVWGLLNGLMVAAESLIPTRISKRLAEFPKATRAFVNAVRLFYVWLTTGFLRWMTAYPDANWEAFLQRVRGMVQLPFFSRQYDSVFYTVTILICFAVVSYIELRTERWSKSPTAVFVFTAIVAFLFAIIWFDSEGTYSYGRF